jgi:hypothetical protein
MNNAIQIKMIVEVDRQRVVDTLINALEGGSNYWIEKYSLGSGEDDSEKELQNILNNKATMTIQENERDAKTYQLTGECFEKALQKMANMYSWHFKNLVDENDDAETADVLLQLATFGRIIYG